VAQSPTLGSPSTRLAAAEDRRLAALDRARAHEYLLATYRDPVTGVLNRQPGYDRLTEEVERAHRTTSPLAVVFVDIDGLKLVNDSRGHQGGDQLLAATGGALSESLRAYDVVVRWGGDEFVCGLPNASPDEATAGITRAAHLLSSRIPGAAFSAGHSQLRPADTLEDVLGRADDELYRHRRGRPSRDHLELSPAPPETGRVSSAFCRECGAPFTEEALGSSRR
jgi:diguanylate cyclase (GGDEF)-like protein